MKYLAILIIAIAVFSSCKKKYTCACYSIDPRYGDTTYYDIKAGSKTEADKNCPPPPITITGQGVCYIQ